MPNAPHNTPTARNISTDLAECYAIELGGRLLGYAARRHGAPAFSLNLDNGTDLLASPATVAEAIDYIADASLLVDWCTRFAHQRAIVRYSIPARWLTLAIQAAR